MMPRKTIKWPGLLALSLIGLELIFFFQIKFWYPSLSYLWPYLIIWVGASAFATFLIVQFFWNLGAGNKSIYEWVYPAVNGMFLLLALISMKEMQFVHDQAEQIRIQEAREQLRVQIAKQNSEVLKQIKDRDERAKKDRFVRYEGRISDVELDKIRQLDRELIQPLRDKAVVYSELAKTLPIKTVDDWLRARNVKELKKQKEVVLKLYEASKSLEDQLLRFTEDYNKAIKGLNLSDAGNRVAVAERERVFQFLDKSYAREIRSLEIEFMGKSSQLLGLLIERFGEWRWDYQKQDLWVEDESLRQSIEYIVFDLIRLAEALNNLILPEEPKVSFND